MQTLRFALLGTLASTVLLGLVTAVVTGANDPESSLDPRFWFFSTLAIATTSPLWASRLSPSWSKFGEERWGRLMLVPLAIGLAGLGGCVGAVILSAGL